MDLVLGFWFFLGIIIGWCWWKKKNKDEVMEMKCEIPKGSSGWPWIGETLDFISCGYSSRPVSFMEKRNSLYGKVFKSHLLGIPIIVSTDPDVNKVVLQNNGSVFTPYYPKTVTELFGKDSIIQLNGNLQKRVHGLLGGFLRSPQLKARITKEIEKCLQISMDTWKDTHLVYIQEETKNITFQVLVRVLMSVGPGEELQFLRREYAEFIKGLICLPIKLPGTQLYKSLKAKERLLKMVRRIVEEKKMRMEKAYEKPAIMDAVDVLLCDAVEGADETQRVPLDFISGNIVEMMIPGEDSVPMLMTLAVKFLTDSPLALKQLTEENMQLKRQKSGSCGEIEWADYMSLPFTQNVVNESLRMANIVNAVWRKALKDVEIKGYLIPKGWGVMASFAAVHMDEENYENPFQFDPWRWQRKEGNLINSNCFTPYGGGQRLCPGLELSRLELAIFLHHLVTRYRWVAKEDHIVSFPMVKMKNKLPITVTPIYA